MLTSGNEAAYDADVLPLRISVKNESRSDVCGNGIQQIECNEVDRVLCVPVGHPIPLSNRY